MLSGCVQINDNSNDDDDDDDDDSYYHGNVSECVELPLMVPDDGVASRTPALQPRQPSEL